MAVTCRDDPVVCLDAVALLIAEFLKDWTTLAMLLKLRDDQRKAREAAYVRQMTVYLEKREQMVVTTWDLSRK